MPKHLLVVDDDPAVRRSLTRALEADGLRVSAAANAAEGLALFSGSAIDLVILDLFLPDQHGLEVLKRMRERDPDAGIVVVTA
ncbi:MAG: response regulator, partial [bacterium]